MAPTGSYQPVPGGGSQAGDEMKGLAAAMEAVRATAGKSTADLGRYRQELVKEAEQTRQTKGEVAKFADMLKYLQKGSKELSDTFSHVGENMAREQGLLTDAMQSEYEEKKKFLAQAIEDVRKSGTSQMDLQAKVGAFHAEGRRLEVENMHQRLNTTVAYGKASKMLDGIAGGAWANMKKGVLSVSESVGGFLGLSGGTMATMAGFGAILAVFGAMVQTVAKNAKDATQAGLELGSSTMSLSGAYMQAVRNATGMGPGNTIQVFNQEKFKATWKALSEEFLYDVGLSGAAFHATLAMSKESRTAQRLAAADFLSDAMKVGTAYGIEAEEAAKLSVAMGRMSFGTANQRKGMENVNKQFMVMAEAAQRFGIPVQALISNMGELTKMTWGLNLPVETLTAQTLGLYKSMENLGKSGVFGFTGMKSEQLQKATSELIKTLGGVDTRRQMALTQTPGGTWGQALERLIKDPMNTLQKAIGQTMKLMGTGISATTDLGTLKAEAFVRLAKGLGLGGNEKQLYEQGVEVAKAWQEGRLDPATVRQIKGRQIDEQFVQAKSVGQNLAMGTDIMQVIAGTAMNILRVLVELTDRFLSSPLMIGAGKSMTATQLMSEYRQVRPYGSSAGGNRRWARE